MKIPQFSPPQSLQLALAMLLLPLSGAALAQKIEAPDELIFSCVRNLSDSQPYVIRNTGTAPLQITSVTLVSGSTANFSLVSPPSLPRTIAAGGSFTYNVKFAPGSTIGPISSALRIACNDPARSVLYPGLFGLSARDLEGANEPTLNNICVTLGYKIDVGSLELILGTGSAPIGDEVIQPLFVKAGPGVVTMKPVARYSPDDLLDFGYYTKSGSTVSRKKVATIKLAQHQKLNPQLTTSAAPTFDPGTATFGLYSGPAPAYANYNVYSEDSLNSSPVPIRHAVRIYPIKNRSGAPLPPNTYLVCMEPAKNGDYQDYVYLLSNVKPAGALPDGTYKINAVHSGKALDVKGASVEDNAPVQQWTYTGSQNQRWQVTAVSGGYYKIVASQSAKALSIPKASLDNKVQAVQLTYTGADNQLWKFDLFGGNFRIVAKHSGKALDVTGKSLTNGAPVTQYTPGTATNQQWQLSAP